ncbi:MAG: transketolase [Christensenellales bacterium]
MADTSTVKRLEGLSLQIRKHLLELCNQTNIHIGGDLSVADVMTVIWQHAMNYDPQNPKMEDRDRFVLSKGHAAAVTSLNQALLGCYKIEEIFNEYATDYGRFGMHSCNLINPHVEVSTGSLGHGLPVSAGIAAGLRALGLDRSRVYVVVGDGELDEGSMWEAMMSAPKFKLGNLVVAVDRNRRSMDGDTEVVMPLEPLADKLRLFGWNVVEVDGHDMNALVDVYDSLPDPASDRPTIIVAATVKGKGVSFMEDDRCWHAGKLSDESFAQAIAEVEDAYKQKWGDA